MRLRFEMESTYSKKIYLSALVILAWPCAALSQEIPAPNFQSVVPIGNQSPFEAPIFSSPAPVAPQSYLQVTPSVQTPDGRTAILYGQGVAQSISLDQFASRGQVQQLQGRLDQISQNGQSPQLLTRLDQLAFFARRDFQRLNEGIALSSALTIMPPNPGDRFALTVGGAGFNGRGAGAITGTYRVNESMMVFGGYARSETQNLVKGGATFSFR
ncbi:YadA-like family protein [Methylobacterium sp. Leaf117]|uniref:YadA-like family protein n=1 Tax=Methylobacterium sp. Leaf117 TaxID=1736260 RepID=UPI00138EF91A|nr:YadA-like family protein [Methylobacterium sp. Leaf117]